MKLKRTLATAFCLVATEAPAQPPAPTQKHAQPVLASNSASAAAVAQAWAARARTVAAPATPAAMPARAAAAPAAPARPASPVAAPPATPAPAAAPPPVAPTPVSAAVPSGGEENLTVRGRRFEDAPMPGESMGKPPEKHPPPHIGRVYISGDQEPHEGRDAHTDAFIAPFGTAYTNAGPVAGGMAARIGN
jgi:hypothetical protein